MKTCRSFLSVYDLKEDDIYDLFERSIFLKGGNLSSRDDNKCLSRKKIGLIFEKSSTRTRVSFEVGVVELGGYPIFMSSRDLQLGRGEPIKDTARVLSRYIDGVIIRTFGQDRIEEFAKYFGKPVINGLTDLYHPAQILADIFTAYEIKAGDGPKAFNSSYARDVVKNLKISYFGDINNIANSWISLQALLGFELVIAAPEGFDIDDKVLSDSKKKGGIFVISHDKIAAASNSDVIATDVFVSMGQEDNKEKANKLKPFMINDDVIDSAKDDVIFLHCLPVHRNEEVSESVFERFSSDVFMEAENRLYMQKAIMEMFFN